MTLWLYLHFPQLQLDSLFAEQNALPLCIIEQHSVVQCNAAAAKQGITPGMGLGSAAALCNQLQVHPYQAEREGEKLQEVAHWLYILTSDIALFPPQGLALKVSNMLTLYDGLDGYWQSLQPHLDTLQLRYQYACAHSPLAARLLARAGLNQISDNRAYLQQQLQRYPIAAAELSNKISEKLQRVGIRSLNELLTLPLADIARRFDIELVNYIGRLTGRFKHPLEFYYPPEQFRRHLDLLYELENIAWLEKPLNNLFAQLEAFLRLRDQLACELQLTLHQRDGGSQQITFSSAQGDYLAARWHRLSQLTLESVKLSAPVTSLTLQVSNSRAQQPEDQDLFDGPQGNHSALGLISLLQAKLGKQAVQGLMLTDDPRPEKATLLCEPVMGKTGTALSPTTALSPATALRPSLLLPQPLPLDEQVSLVHGPERLATGWWDSGGIIRDYFIARSHSGRWLWLFRNREKQWFVHGIFS
jgi:protein ImuB